MARSMWTGVIGFGMVSIPVSLSAATKSKDVALHQLHDKCQTRIKEVRWCPHCEVEVPWEHVQKGYEYSKGHYMALTGEDFEQLPLPSKKIVEVAAFVAAEEIDPIYFEKSYYVEPEQSGERPFALFLEALSGKDMVAIGTIAFRSRERLCVLRPAQKLLILTTLLYADEIREEPPVRLPKAAISKKELDMADSLIDLLSQKFNPEEYQDHYREALNDLVQLKLEGVSEGEALDAASARGSSGRVVDLMDALKESIAGAKKGGSTKSRNKQATARKPRRRAKAETGTRKQTARAKKSSSTKRRVKRGAA